MRTLLAAALSLFLLIPQLLKANDSPQPAEFAAFWKALRNAAAKNDPEAVAALSNALLSIRTDSSRKRLS